MVPALAAAPLGLYRKPVAGVHPLGHSAIIRGPKEAPIMTPGEEARHARVDTARRVSYGDQRDRADRGTRRPRPRPADLSAESPREGLRGHDHRDLPDRFRN